MAHDVILNKIATIERCIRRIHEEYDGYEESFKHDYTKQDSVILNLERLSQATIDIATYIIRDKKLGLPNTSRELFLLLKENHIITEQISMQMQAMVGFRNIAVHDYQNLNIEIVIAIVEKHLSDFEHFRDAIFENYLS
jgi:uncharacterized protein YutE (UPF0331/DUF86 family)